MPLLARTAFAILFFAIHFLSYYYVRFSRELAYIEKEDYITIMPRAPAAYIFILTLSRHSHFRQPDSGAQLPIAATTGGECRSENGSEEKYFHYIVRQATYIHAYRRLHYCYFSRLSLTLHFLR